MYTHTKSIYTIKTHSDILNVGHLNVNSIHRHTHTAKCVSGTEATAASSRQPTTLKFVRRSEILKHHAHTHSLSLLVLCKHLLICVRRLPYDDDHHKLKSLRYMAAATATALLCEPPLCLGLINFTTAYMYAVYSYTANRHCGGCWRSEETTTT